MNSRSRNPLNLSPGRDSLQPSLNGRARESAYENSGAIWIKFPAGTRGNSLRAWSKKFTSIRSELFLQPDSVHLCALLLIQRSEKPDSETVFKKRLTSQNTIIFRSKSRTQQHSFTICVDDEPVIHLSSFSETDSQSWISCIRSILWPPTSFAQLEKTLGSHFDVSIIDNEFSFRAGLLGMYGNLQITSDKAVLTHPQTNEVVQEWQLSTVGFKLLPQAHSDDQNKIVTMITDSNSATGYGTIVMFCVDAEGLIRRVHSVRQMFVQKSYGDQMQEDMTQSASLAQSYSIYKVPKPASPRISPSPEEVPNFEFRKSLADPWLDKIVHDTIGEERKRSGPAEAALGAKKMLWNNMANIPEIMLDSSINFRNGCRTIPEEGSESGRLPLRESQSIEEEEDSYYRSLHEKIASGD